MGATLRNNDLACALGALTATLVLTQLTSPSAVGGAALAAVMLAGLAPGTVRRLDIVATAAIWGMIAAMFGLTGVGCFVLAQVLVVSLAVLARSLLPATSALVFLTAVSAIVAACGAPYVIALLGQGWSPAGPVIVIVMIGAPGALLHHAASALRGGERAEHERLLALGPQLAAMAVGGGVGGLEGVAAVVAISTLAIPLALLILPGPRASRRFRTAFRGIGVLAAGFVGCVSVVIALRFADGRAAAIPPAVGLGVLLGLVALKVHAPGVAHHLAHIGFGARARTQVTQTADAKS